MRGARELPREIFDIHDEIEILDASEGSLSALSDNLGDLKNLRIAFFSSNPFESIPAVLASCPKLEMVGFRSCGLRTIHVSALPPKLRGLIVTDNQISELPEDIGKLTQLQKLMLAGNQLTSLPHSLLGCERLELLRVSLNQLEASPDWLFELPRLAWYGDSTNTFRHSDAPLHVNAPKIRWEDLEILDMIGKSTNNKVYAARLDGKDVAVKLFGNSIITDGSPLDDMRASLLAGKHPNLIGGIGQLAGTPNGQEGFVMPLIPNAYAQLGLPPDLVTLTRDVFADGQTFSGDFIRQAANDVAQALLHLTQQGITHGDIYAHNILSDAQGNSYLGDFGAASLYTPGSQAGLLRERIEVRGFGNLLDDLLARCPAPPAALTSLRDACLTTDPGSRPAFADITTSLI